MPSTKIHYRFPKQSFVQNVAFGQAYTLHNSIIIPASQCSSNVTVIMKNILTFSRRSRNRANLISKAKQRRNALNNHCV